MKKDLNIAVFAGGCFWCTQAVFQNIYGVKKVVAGYSGGNIENLTYEEVALGNTGHAESVNINLDPGIISYNTLLDIFGATRDPTTVNRQGADIGTQYRSAIFYLDKVQKNTALNSKNELAKNAKFPDPIVTQIVPFKNFYRAEKYHQEYYIKNKNQPYCRLVIDPKILKLNKQYKNHIR